MIGEALYIANGEGAATAERVIPRGPVHLAIVAGRRQRAVEARFSDGAIRLVPSSDLALAAPLSASEEAEYQRLDAQLAGTIGEARALKRFNQLRLRSLLFGSET